MNKQYPIFVCVIILAFTLGSCQPNEVTVSQDHFSSLPIPTEAKELIRRVNSVTKEPTLYLTPLEKSSPVLFFKRLNLLRERDIVFPVKLNATTPTKSVNPQKLGDNNSGTEYADDPVTKSYFFSGANDNLFFGRIRIDVTTDGQYGRIIDVAAFSRVSFLVNGVLTFGAYTQDEFTKRIFNAINNSRTPDIVTFQIVGTYSPLGSPVGTRWAFEGYLQIPRFGGTTFGGGGGIGANQLMGNATMIPWLN